MLPEGVREDDGADRSRMHAAAVTAMLSFVFSMDLIAKSLGT